MEGDNSSTIVSYDKYVPKITVFIVSLSILFFFIGFFSNALEDIVLYYFAPTALDIFLGKYWGLFTYCFIHVNVIHLLFNLFWVWFFGKKIEFESGKLFFLVLFCTSAIISSISEIFISDSTGVGLSGIVYALFGYVLIMSLSNNSYKKYLNIKIIILFFALPLLSFIPTM